MKPLSELAGNPNISNSIVDNRYATLRQRREYRDLEGAETYSIHSELISIGAARSNLPLERAFWSRVHQPDEGCWDWMGGNDGKGYGSMRHRGKLYRTHVLALELSLGRPLSEGMMALHRCDRPRCCRPDHLYEGTESDNQRDRIDRRAGKRPAVLDITEVPESAKYLVDYGRPRS